MDLQLILTGLIESHNKRTQHLKGLSRSLIQKAYADGVTDCLRVIQQEALDDSMKQQLSGPLAVQANHVATEERK